MAVVTQVEQKTPAVGRVHAAAELILVGLNHKRADIKDREKLVVAETRLESILAGLHRKDLLCGLTVLSTCNRVECYGSSFDSANAEIRLKEFFSGHCPGIEKFLYVMRGEPVVKHLFRVASGLDSMVVGEHQILGQVKNAYMTAYRSGYTDKLMNRLFQRALCVGKLVRSKTNISQGITSCGGAAVALAERIFGKMDKARIMLVGAGKMAESAAQHLLSRKAVSIIVSNRRREKAQELASQFGGAAMGLEEGMRMIHEMDVVIASTACPHYLITKQRVRQVLERRSGRSLILIDLGVPRNIDPDVKSIEGVHLYNIDSLEAVIKETLAKRQGGIHAAEEIVKQCADEFTESPALAA